MTLPSDLLGPLGALLPWDSLRQGVAPGAACVFLLTLLLLLCYRLGAEHMRGRSLLQAYKHAPGGTTVEQRRGPGGPAVTIMVGHGPRPPAVSPGASCPMISHDATGENGFGGAEVSGPGHHITPVIIVIECRESRQ